MTQQQVADALGKPQSFVAKVEGYERRLDVIELIEFCRTFNGDAIELLRPIVDSQPEYQKHHF